MIILDDWQKEVLAHKGHLLLCTGRQVGKTYIFSRKCAERMMEKAGTRIIIASLSEDQAKLIIVMILDYLEKVNKKQIATGNKKPTQNKIQLKNGSFALARPVGNTGDALRGFTGDVLVLDEVSRYNEMILLAAKPTLASTGGEIWMCSTPYGKQGYFWECFQNKSGRFKVVYTSTEKVYNERPISEEWTEERRRKALEFLEGEKKEMSELKYGQEYLGLFVEDLRQFFPDELIDKCCTLRRDPNMVGDKFLGVDIARFGDDETTFEIVSKIDGKCYHIESITTTKKPTTWTENQIVALDKMYEFKKIGIDAGSGALGVGVYDHLMEMPHIKRKLEAMNNRALSLDRHDESKQRMMKEDFYDSLKAMMEHGEIKLLDDEGVRLSLKSIQYELKVEEDQDSRLRIFGKYSHIVEGLIRAAWLARKSKSINIRIDYV